MSYPTVFANLTAGNQPASLLDTMFNICGNQGNIACTATGTNAITLTPNTNFFSPGSYTNYQMFTFVAAATSTGNVTIQVAALAALPLFLSNLNQASAGDIVSATSYTVVFNQALQSGSGGFQLLGVGSSAALVPTGAEIPFAGIAAPAGWYMAFGQAVNRTTDAPLFNALTATATGNTHSNTSVDGISVDLRFQGLVGAFIEGSGIPTATTITAIGSSTSLTMSSAASTTVVGASLRILPFGQGNASTTFNIPDRRGKVLAARSDMGGTDNSLLSTINGTQLSSTGGEQTHVLVTGELASHLHSITDPGHVHSASSTDAGHTHTSTYNFPTGTIPQGAGGLQTFVTGGSVGGGGVGWTTDVGVASISTTVNSHTTGITQTNNQGSGTAHNNLQPMGISNMIIKR